MYAVRTSVGVIFTPRADVAKRLREATVSPATTFTRNRARMQALRVQASTRTA